MTIPDLGHCAGSGAQAVRTPFATTTAAKPQSAEPARDDSRSDPTAEWRSTSAAEIDDREPSRDG